MDRKQHVLSVSFAIWNMGVIEHIRAGPWPYQSPTAFFKTFPKAGPDAYRALCQLAEALFPLRALIKKMLHLEVAAATWDYASICAMGCPAFAASHFCFDAVDRKMLLIAAFVSRDTATLAHVMGLVLHTKADFLELRKEKWPFMTVFFEHTTAQYANKCNCLWNLCALGSVEMLIALHARYNFIAEDFIDVLAAFSPMVGACNSDEQLPILQWIVGTFGIKLTGPLKNAMVETCIKMICPEILLWLDVNFGLEHTITDVYMGIKNFFAYPRCNRFVVYMFKCGNIDNFSKNISGNQFLAMDMLMSCLAVCNIRSAFIPSKRLASINTRNFLGWSPSMLSA
jgi:hypothetical protein